MALVSLAEYGKLHGASKQAAAKWKARGCLVIREDKVDVAASDQRMQHAALGRFKGKPKPAIEPTAVVGPAPAAVVDADDPAQVKTLDAFVEQLLRGEFATAYTANVVKENALALKHVLAARREAGQLIDVAAAETILFEAARTVRAAFMNFPTRVGPLMAAELGIESDRLVEVLSTHVHQQLADLGEPEFGLAGRAAPEASLRQGDHAAASDQHPGVGGPL